MRLSTFIVPALGLGLGAALLLPAQQADAWSTIGGSLGQSQRDFRTFNNFSDPSDNNNQTPDPQFPGYQGANMAIWKGCIEWGSIAHGDGSGDPTQAVLGGSGANFDPSFQGEATAVGGSNDNTHSQISGSSGGVLAYCETPISNGWRIRYYEGWNWSDGPGTIGQNQFDLQGVACHEYGHALGLGHSTVGGATMYPSIANGVEAQRSIHSDDSAGCQAVYGSMSGTKPTITGVSVSGNQITVTGTGFDGSGNQVWFTQASAGGNGTPVKVTGLSSNGSSITATIPGGAGPGDVLVRRNSTGHAGLSNSWPSDLQDGGGPGGGCNDPVNFCSFLPNSVGSGATITFSGTASLTANDLVLTGLGLPSSVPGIFFYADNQTAVLFGEGLLCATGNIKRLGVLMTDVLGTVSKSLDLSSPPFDSGTGEAISGEEKNFQFWYRDVPGGPSGFNTTDGLSVTFCD